MRGVACEGKAALKADRRVFSVAQADGPRAHQSVELVLSVGLGLELANAYEVVEFRQGHLRSL